MAHGRRGVPRRTQPRPAGSSLHTNSGFYLGRRKGTRESSSKQRNGGEAMRLSSPTNGGITTLLVGLWKGYRSKFGLYKQTEGKKIERGRGALRLPGNRWDIAVGSPPDTDGGSFTSRFQTLRGGLWKNGRKTFLQVLCCGK